MKHNLLRTKRFERKLKKLVNKNSDLEKELKKRLGILRTNPRHPSLKTHKVNTKFLGTFWSSRLSDDLRIAWIFHDDFRDTIVLIDIGGHEGKHRIYRSLI